MTIFAPIAARMHFRKAPTPWAGLCGLVSDSLAGRWMATSVGRPAEIYALRPSRAKAIGVSNFQKHHIDELLANSDVLPP